MALTPGGTPYVEASDLVADYPATSLALAEHIDDLPAAILQVVRATDTTNRSTSSASFVDASLSVTITPQKSDSAIILLAKYRALINQTAAGPAFVEMQITDASNNAISGAEASQFGGSNFSNPRIPILLIGYATPAVITAVTHKVRFRKINGTDLSLENNAMTAQMYAIEVSA